MNPFYIIADDLTGASDSGVQFAKRGYTTSLLFNRREIAAWNIDLRVVVADTDSRGSAPEEAYERVARFISALQVPANHLIYKKVDSTLRGNLRSEVQAVLDTLPESVAFIVPAYPQNGRTTRNGIQYLQGVPVHETEIGRDPKTPVSSSFIPDLLGGSCFLIDTAAIEKGAGPLKNQVEDAVKQGYFRIVFDAETSGHLETIARLYPLFPKAVWVGSAGIAEHLVPPLPVGEISTELPVIRRPLLFLVGSLSESTREQVDMCSAERFFTLRLDPVRLLKQESTAQIAALVREPFKKGKHCIVALQATEQARQQAAAFAAECGLAAAGVSDLLREALGKLSAALVADLQPECLFLTGGDTARSICEHLGFGGMNILSELEPGIPLGRIAGTRFYLVTKAGAFGNAQTFEHIAEQLTKEGLC